jgi:hypothetical protein
MTTAPLRAVLTIADRAGGAARRETVEYSAGASRPLGGYLAALSAYGGMCAALVGVGHGLGARPPDRISAADLALITVATHKCSRILTKDPVTSPLRAPFTRFRGQTGPAELAEEVRETSSIRHSAGELLTCPFCVAQWVATGFVFGLVVAPRGTRLVASVFAAVAGSDALQLVYARLEQAAE